MKQKIILYLRTDSDAKELVAGGSVSHTIGVVTGFAKCGYRIVCASSAMLKIIKQLSLYRFIALVMPSWLKFLGHKGNALFSNIFFTWQTSYLCHKYDIDFIYQRYSILNCTGVLLSLWYDKKLILEFNSSKVWTDAHWSPNKKIKMRWLVRLIEKINIAYAHRIVAVSQPIKEMLIKDGAQAEKIVVNPNGVDTELFDSEKLAQKREEIRAALGIEKKFVFGFIGTFSYWHGIDELAQMIPRITALSDDVHFLLIGGGPLHKVIKDKIINDDLANSVTTFTGMVPSQKAREYLSACDAFLSPIQPNPDGSPFFGSPTKLFEYMSLSKPIIASDLEQIAEVINPALRVEDIFEKKVVNQESIVGILVQPQDVPGFVKAACWLREQDSVIQKKLGNTARSKACVRHTWVQHVQNIIDSSR